MNLKEAAEYFKVSTKSMAEFTRKNVDKINTNGIHVIKVQGRWAYDGEAIRIIEELKGLNVNTAAEVVREEKNAVEELRHIADNLQSKLTTAMAEVTQTALALVDAERRNSAQQAELATLRERAKVQAEMIAKLEESERCLKKQAAESLQYQADLKAERSMLQEKLNRERNMPWWKRLLPHKD